MGWFILFICLALSGAYTVQQISDACTESTQHTTGQNITKPQSYNHLVREDAKEKLITLANSTSAVGLDSNSMRNLTYDNKPECDLAYSSVSETKCQGTLNLTRYVDYANEEIPQSKETASTVQFAVNIILFPLIAIPGCVCNVFNVYILTRRSMRNSTHCYLTGLSVADLFYLITIIVKWIFYLVEYFNKTLFLRIMMSMHAPILDYSCIILFGRTSNLLTMVLSIERFIAVKFPLMAKTSPFTRYPMKIIVGVYLFVSLAVLPTVFKYKFGVAIDSANTTSLIYEKSDLYLSNAVFFRGYALFILISLRFIPVLTVFVLNCCTIVILNMARKRMTATTVSNMDARQKEELKVTRMLIAIAGIFLVCVSPGFVHAVFQGFMPTYFSNARYQNLWVIFFTIYPLIDAVNAAVNFIVYILMSKKFRALCLNTLRKKGHAMSQAAKNDTI